MKFSQKWNNSLKQNRLSIRIIIYVIIFSTLFTLLVTMFQLFINYNKDINTVNENFTLVKDTYLASISRSVFLLDDDLLKSQLDGILKIRDIKYVEVNENLGETVLKFHAGTEDIKQKIRTEFILTYERTNDRIINIGKLILVADRNEILMRLIKNSIFQFLINALIIAIVSFFILLIIQKMVTNQLTEIAHFTSNLD